MRTEDRRLLILSLNNTLKGPFYPELQEKSWRQAESRNQEMDQLNM